jgi:hypothetical protein
MWDFYIYVEKNISLDDIREFVLSRGGIVPVESETNHLYPVEDRTNGYAIWLTTVDDPDAPSRMVKASLDTGLCLTAAVNVTVAQHSEAFAYRVAAEILECWNGVIDLGDADVANAETIALVRQAGAVVWVPKE